MRPVSLTLAMLCLSVWQMCLNKQMHLYWCLILEPKSQLSGHESLISKAVLDRSVATISGWTMAITKTSQRFGAEKACQMSVTIQQPGSSCKAVLTDSMSKPSTQSAQVHQVLTQLFMRVMMLA
jgi:hypothetical protein